MGFRRFLSNSALLILLLGGAVGLAQSILLGPQKRDARALSHYKAEYLTPDFQTSVARIDEWLERHWAKHQRQPAPRAPDLAVARRLALGIMGTIPSVAEIRQLEALPQEDRLPWWIDQILREERSADYLAERFARAYVGTENGPFIFYRRRRFVTWLSGQLSQGVAYDQIVRELITSKGLWTDQPATNFVTVTSKPDSKNQPDPIRLAGRVTRAFLGLRLDCAECHNHPYAEWKRADFQGLAAFFGQTHLGFTGVYSGAGEFEAKPRPTEESVPITPRVPFAPELLPGPEDHQDRRQRLAIWVTHPKNPYFARAAVNRVWALLFGRPLVDPVDNLPSPTDTENAPDMMPVLDLLAQDFSSNGFDLRRLIRLIASTRVFRLDSQDLEGQRSTEADEKAWALFPLTRLRPEQVVGSIQQSSSVTTLNSESHWLFRLARFGQENDFVKRYGDSGEDEFGGKGGTIPQRLLLMNGNLTRERIRGAFNASAQIAWMARDPRLAVEAAYLTVLTRRPTRTEADHFERALRERAGDRTRHLEDLFWVLLNSTEFSWNH